MSESVLILGGGGREHALAWKLAQSTHVDSISVAPGNVGTLGMGCENVPIEPTDIKGLVVFALKREISLTVVGPDEALAVGTVDAFRAEKLPIFGPTRAASKLEWSKAFATRFMQRHNIPTPVREVFDERSMAEDYVHQHSSAQDIVIKADGLAAGKGVFLPKTFNEAHGILFRLMIAKELGSAGKTVVIQERLAGKELSVFALCDGTRTVMLPFCRDHKRLLDGDKGPNTGSMGAFGPVHMEPELSEVIESNIVQPTIEGMSQEGHLYKGLLYVGLMLSGEGPKVIEYNARFGDPECQAQMLLIDEDIYPRLRQVTSGKLSAKPIRLRDGYAVTVALAAAGYPDEPRKGDEIYGLELTKDLAQNNVQVFHGGTKRVGDRIVTNGGRVLHIAAYGETLEVARSQAYSAIGEQAIHFADMQYRGDIGDSA